MKTSVRKTDGVSAGSENCRFMTSMVLERRRPQQQLSLPEKGEARVRSDQDVTCRCSGAFLRIKTRAEKAKDASPHGLSGSGHGLAIGTQASGACHSHARQACNPHTAAHKFLAHILARWVVPCHARALPHSGSDKILTGRDNSHCVVGTSRAKQQRPTPLFRASQDWWIWTRACEFVARIKSHLIFSRPSIPLPGRLEVQVIGVERLQAMFGRHGAPPIRAWAP